MNHDPLPQCCKIMPPHHAKYDGRGRIHHLQQYSGPHRGGFCQVAYESESDSESDWRGHPPARTPHRNQQHCTSTSHCFAQVSQATPREDTQALKGSRSSGPPRESSGRGSGPFVPSIFFLARPFFLFFSFWWESRTPKATQRQQKQTDAKQREALFLPR